MTLDWQNSRTLDAGRPAVVGDRHRLLTSLLSGWVADVAGESTTAGATVDQWAADGGAHQTWTLTQA